MRALMLIALGLGGCASETGGVPEQEWPYAVAHADCAPWDGAATTIELSNSPNGAPRVGPWLHLSVYRGIGDNAGRAILDGMQTGSLSATLCVTESDCVSAQSGWVDLAPQGDSLAGQYNLHLSDGRTIAGKFLAPVTSMRVLCG